MNLPQKLISLRAARGMTQEELAERCQVSRQSVSKWESGRMQPTPDNLVRLSEIFAVSADVLLKEDWQHEVTRESGCHADIVSSRQSGRYQGILIKESLDDEAVLDLLHIHKVELWKTGGHPRYWTALFFSSTAGQLPEHLAAALKPSDSSGVWFADFREGNIKYIVFRDRILHYRIGNASEKQAACQACRDMGLSEEQMQWPEEEENPV